VRVKPVGDTIKPSPKVTGYFGSIERQSDTGMTTTVAVAGYDPATGQQAWYAELPGTTNTGNLVTGGDVVFQSVGNGDFYVLDAKTGRQLFKTTLKSGVTRGSSLTYRVNGKQYVSVIGGNVVYALGLPWNGVGRVRERILAPGGMACSEASYSLSSSSPGHCCSSSTRLHRVASSLRRW
jgi:outer membrane protein assembly factor BamB